MLMGFIAANGYSKVAFLLSGTFCRLRYVSVRQCSSSTCLMMLTQMRRLIYAPAFLKKYFLHNIIFRQIGSLRQLGCKAAKQLITSLFSKPYFTHVVKRLSITEIHCKYLLRRAFCKMRRQTIFYILFLLLMNDSLRHFLCHQTANALGILLCSCSCSTYSYCQCTADFPRA